jgi:calcium-dependent protein kinase
MKIFDEMMQSLDRNCNGVIDYTEFLTAASNKENILTDENLFFAFRMFDSDKNGTISKQELKQVFETSEKKDDELWNEIFNEVDLD